MSLKQALDASELSRLNAVKRMEEATCGLGEMEGRVAAAVEERAKVEQQSIKAIAAMQVASPAPHTLAR